MMQTPTVQQALSEMSKLVDRGNFAEARVNLTASGHNYTCTKPHAIVQAAETGNAAEVPLGISMQAVQMNEKISQGTQSTVINGLYSGHRVAVKKAKISKGADLESFKLETIIMAKLSHVTNVVNLIAARLLPPGYMLIMPYIPHNLSVRIHHDGWRPNWPTICHFATSLATALTAIHAAGVLHRDIKPGNILLDNSNTPYICDFGIAILAADLDEDDAGGSKHGKPSGGFHKRNMIGTLEYMAPETLHKQPPSDKSDVWALAVTLNELATGVFPYSDCTHENPAAHTVLEMGYGRQELAAGIATEGLLPLMKPNTPKPFAALLESCWKLNPAERPSAAQMLEALQAMHFEASVEGSCTAGQAGPPQSQTAANENQAGKEDLTFDQHMSTPERRMNARQPPQKEQYCNSTYRPQVTAGAFATAGLRGADRMEDSHVIQPELGEQTDLHLLAVFDGHRGPQTAQYAAQHIASVLLNELKHQTAAEALHASFVSLDASFRHQQEEDWMARVQRMGQGAAGKQAWPGCTALAVLVKQNWLYVANAGDCRAVLCRSGSAVALSQDQTADASSERELVQAAGASVRWLVDSWRVGDAGIQVTRSLGDADLKPAVTAQPELTQSQLSAEDDFVILASDGLWDKLSNEDAVGLVMDTVKQPVMASQRLATEALTRGSGDNITVVVAFLKPVDTLESVFKGGKQKHAATPTFYSSRQGKAGAYQQPSVDEVSETL